METIYKANDGEVFTNLKDCAKHETLKERILEIMTEAKDYCRAADSCEDCPLCLDDRRCIFDSFSN